MPGNEKLRQLNEFRTRIEELVAVLEGRDPTDVITSVPSESEEELGELNGEE
jgi:hypothetical protein